MIASRALRTDQLPIFIESLLNNVAASSPVRSCAMKRIAHAACSAANLATGTRNTTQTDHYRRMTHPSIMPKPTVIIRCSDLLATHRMLLHLLLLSLSL